ncbi:MAG: FN3 associated domain-containing protein, partial [Bacteroidota bacterium]
MEIVQFFGRLHPLILHLPVGILAIAFLMELAGKSKRYQNLQPAVGFALMVGMWSAIFAVVSGYLLSWEGGYEAATLNLHKWLGIATAAIAVIVYFLHRSKASSVGKKIYFPTFGGLMLLLTLTGHYGGSLTHGSDFLTEPFDEESQEDEVVITNMDSALVFNDLIEPILQQKCVSCHNESKIKGDLLMTTPAGLQAGGKTGAFFVAGDAANSLFLQRAHLPIENKKHMPPKGKKQLTKDEIALLEWWVQEGAHFDKKVGALEQPETVKTILGKYVTPDQSVFALKIDPPSESSVRKIKQSGIPIEYVAQDLPFVTVSLRGREDIDKSTFKQLSDVAEQVIELDLSKTNMTDELLSYLEDFPHLQKLFLQRTQVTGKSLAVIDQLKYLEYLNLYETPLEDNALQSITKLASLQNVYLWRTNVSPKAIEALKNARPRLHVNTGINTEIFGGSSLKAPLIMVERDIFQDSIQVEFKINFKNVDLFYTLDGTLPDSTSFRYTEPFKLTQTADIQVIAKKEGWETSEPSSKSVLRAKYQPKAVQLDQPPHERYQAEGASSLVNFKKGMIDFTSGEWLGYEKENLIATLDMGASEAVSAVTVSALESTSSYIFFPKQLKVSVSKDGKNF